MQFNTQRHVQLMEEVSGHRIFLDTNLRQRSAMGVHLHIHVFERGIVIAVRYRDEVLEYLVRLFMGVVGPDFLMAGNASHIYLIWSRNFWKVRIFTGWTGQLDLLTTSL
ncbi:hypothetical protein TNCV_4873871 [Trichonephila clavipes]|nr:hypothetical protein TNCV_4873871 [Trichonephila clavipes]